MMCTNVLHFFSHHHLSVILAIDCCDRCEKKYNAAVRAVRVVRSREPSLSPIVPLTNLPMPNKRPRSGSIPDDPPQEASQKKPRSDPQPRYRQGLYRENAALALQRWRSTMGQTRYANAPFRVSVYLPDYVIKILSRHANLKTVADIKELKMSPPWAFVDRHGEELLAILRNHDEKHAAGQIAAKEGRKKGQRAQARSSKQNSGRTEVSVTRSHFPV